MGTSTSLQCPSAGTDNRQENVLEAGRVRGSSWSGEAFIWIEKVSKGSVTEIPHAGLMCSL